VNEGILKKTNKMTGSVGLYARNDFGSVGLYARNDFGSVGLYARKITPIKGYTTTLSRQTLLS
jgi:hypothetical protein